MPRSPTPWMSRLPIALVIAGFSSLILPHTRAADAQEAPPPELRELKEMAEITRKVMVPMRDGVRLSTTIYRPKGEDRVPTVFVRTPYNFNWYQDGELNRRVIREATEWVSDGYAYVLQNERGRYFSEGNWDILGPPLSDGYDALSWIEEQPWSNGRVGTLGCSSTAEWQMGLASLDHPAHAAMVPMGFGAGVGEVGRFHEQGNWYRGGAEQMLFFTWLGHIQQMYRPTFSGDLSREDRVRVSRYYDLAPDFPPVQWEDALWHLPVVDMLENVNAPRGIFADSVAAGTGGRMIQRTPGDEAWHEGGLYHDDMPFAVPSLWLMSWYDVAISPNLALFNHVRANGETAEVRRNQYALVAPVTHCAFERATEETVVGERDVGDARFAYREMIHGWFDHWLKDEEPTAVDTMPRVRFYTMGENRWQSSEEWPPEDTEMVPFYLSSGEKGANSIFGDGRLVEERPAAADADSFTYDPHNPVPSRGGNVCCIGGAIEAGSFDQRRVEARQDVLVYSTEPLEEAVEVSGTIEIHLYVSSDAPDTDFTVKLVDVAPDGTAYNLVETIQRVRYREGYDEPRFMEEGEVYEIDVSPMSTSNTFRRGHRIRIEVSSSNFPRFTRNLNTGGDNYNETEGAVARNVIHYSDEFPSRILLPVVQE